MVTDERRALWTAIRAHPDDDTPRLVFADWLQEHGDEPRAEFIRLQIELEKLKPDRRKGRKALEAREKALLATHRAEWTDPIVAALIGKSRKAELREWARSWVAQLVFCRGFLSAERLDLERARMLSTLDAIVEPIEVLRVFASQQELRDASLAAFAQWAGSNSAVQIQLAGVTNDGGAAITDSKHFRSLSYLELTHGSISLSGVRQIARWPRAARLFVLDLRGNPITDTGARELVASPYLGALGQLDLTATHISAKGRAELRERFGTRVLLDPEP
jgi:uncharacterized protein (TIGR02996 family)